MVDLVLDDLRRPAGKGLEPLLKLLVLVAHLDGFPALGLAGALQGETALLRLVGLRHLDDLWVVHNHVVIFAALEGDDAFADADHIGGHAHAGAFAGYEGIQQILSGLLVRRSGIRCGLRQEDRVFHNGLNHAVSFFLSPLPFSSARS